ncbi:hypothetical protein BDV34DRAFT_221315 [Aspergillus parasiticus]|uniref:Uncharacterized protein n=1 Tax=Aspergillus parasiticus TaxID=5067 RepID=A0A5N6DYG0_ASPPA|nr:hypothetical protein BDV34DRAFT_221315 [Aspergillus parasiticus]
MDFMDHTLNFEALGKNQLGTKEPLVNSEFITKDAVGKCTFNSRTVLVDYGLYDGKPACLIGFEFTFHPFRSRFIDAEIMVEFIPEEEENQAPPDVMRIALLQPKSIIGPKNETKIKDSLEGRVKLGYEEYVAVEVAGGRETERVISKPMAIIGSQIGETELRWTATEDRETEDGIPTTLVGYIIVQYSSPFKAQVRVNAQAQFWVEFKDALGVVILKMIGKKKDSEDDFGEVAFDTKTKVDRREDRTKAVFTVKNWAETTEPSKPLDA